MILLNLFELTGNVVLNGANNLIRNLEAVEDALGDTAGSFRRLGEELESAGDTLASVGGALTKTITAPLALVGKLFYDSTEEAISFENQMLRVKAVTGANQVEFAALAVKARELGESTVFSATQVSEAMKDMGMAGWNTQQILEGIGPVLDLAAASETDLALTSKVVTGNINAFGLEASDAAMVTDILAKAAMDSKVDIDTLGESLRYAAPMANALGYTLADVSGIMGLFGDSNIGASQSGTTLNAVLRDLVKLTKKDAAPIFEKLGIKAFDLQGNMKPLAEIIKSIEYATANMTDEQRNSLLLMGFNEQALLGINVLLEKGSDKIQTYQDSLKNANGEVQRMSDIIKEGAFFQMEQLSSAVNELQIRLGTALLPVLKNFIIPALMALIEAAQWLVDRFAQINDVVKLVIIVIGSLLAGLGPLLFIVGALTAAWGVIMQGWITSVAIISSVAKAIWGFIAANAMALLKITALAAGLAAIGVLAYSVAKAWDSFTDIFGGIMDWLVNRVLWMGSYVKLGLLMVTKAIVDLVNTTIQKLDIFKDIPFIGDMFSKISAKVQASTVSITNSMASAQSSISFYAGEAAKATWRIGDGFIGFGDQVGKTTNDVITTIKKYTGFAGSSSAEIAESYGVSKEAYEAYMKSLEDGTATTEDNTKAVVDNTGAISKEEAAALLAKKVKEDESAAREAARLLAEAEKKAREDLTNTYKDSLDTDNASLELMKSRLSVVDDELKSLNKWDIAERSRYLALEKERKALQEGIGVSEASKIANEGIIESLKDETNMHKDAVQSLENRSMALQRNINILAKIGITSGKFVDRLKEEKKIVDMNKSSLEDRRQSLTDIDGQIARGEITLETAIKMIDDEREAIIAANEAITAYSVSTGQADETTSKWSDNMGKLRDKMKVALKAVGNELKDFMSGISDELFSDVDFGSFFTNLTSGNFASAFVALFSDMTEQSTVFADVLNKLSASFGSVALKLLPIFEELFTLLYPLIDPLSEILLIAGQILVDVLTPMLPALVSFAKLISQIFVVLEPLLGPLSTLLSGILVILADWLTALMPLLKPIITILTALLKILSPLLTILGALTPIIELISSALEVLLKPIDLVASALDALLKPVEWLLKLLGGITGGGSGLLGGIVDGIGGLVGGIVDGIGGVIGGIGDLFGFAKGGLVTGPTKAIIGEAGDDEAVIPLRDDVLSYIGQSIAAATPGGKRPPGYDDMFSDGDSVAPNIIIQLIGDNMVTDNSTLANFAKSLWPKLKEESTRRGGNL